MLFVSVFLSVVVVVLVVVESVCAYVWVIVYAPWFVCVFVPVAASSEACAGP